MEYGNTTHTNIRLLIWNVYNKIHQTTHLPPKRCSLIRRFERKTLRREQVKEFVSVLLF